MRDTSPRSWQRWRVTLAVKTSRAVVDRFERSAIPIPSAEEAPEQPSADGIRHKLVARIRQEIAAGTYDTEEKWLAAEERLLRRIEALA
jgi:anti-sigma28 factor (negative regulator of flagellin synthesis)